MIYQDAAENRRKERKLRSEIDFDQLYSYANAAQASTKCQNEHRITFFDEELLEEQLWERKVDDFVAKPIEMKEICNCIRKWLPRELIVKIRNKEQNCGRDSEGSRAESGYPAGRKAEMERD